ncbi:YfhO family protein [Streptomyces sp. P9(2023)]|uniref:YfhO family protein n=1 Tax=Streptomyces sp. P9(2023) TaxID=3064394 RepID=UPI0028F40BFA|nr:YfhO family protein [Streptomyces sp. P9(2023)]MDT9691145.1 YfhO family protein [Streptomyces sp. P9(2023)]
MPAQTTPAAVSRSTGPAPGPTSLGSDPASAEPRSPGRFIGRPTALATALAGFLTALAVCVGDAVARTFPFGPERRAVNDLANQFVPYHARLWDLLHGRGDGGLLLNWQSGWGTSFLPDLGTYLGSPFALLVALFPRDDIEYAVYTVTILKMAAAAAAMTFTLLRMRPGVWWAAAVLGASYALCGWSVMEATYNPMWLDGLIAFPLLCLVGEWAREGRRPLLGTLIVTLCWVGNFYTAYMATIGAALVLLLRLVIAHELRIRVIVRAVVTVLLGIGLAAPVLVPVFLGSTHAYPGWTNEFKPAGWTDFFARFLPATYSFTTPAAFLGTGTLLLAGALLFHRAVPRRERRLWAGFAVAVAVSMQWGPTHLVWHVFATPNGSPYRQTFVLSGVLVIAAWIVLSYGWPGRRALLGGVGAVAVVAVGAVASPHVTGWTYPLFALGLAAACGALWLAKRGKLPVVAALLLSGALVGQAAATTAYADRERLGRLDDYPAWGAEQDRRTAALGAADGWPAYRTDSGREQITGNEPMLFGGQGAAYYSSHTPSVLTETLASLGGGWTSRGRNLQSLDNPVTDALFSVGARWRGDRVVRTDADSILPLVTVRPEDAPQPRYGASPYRNQEMLLGAKVYTLPGRREACPVGSEVFLWAPDFRGTARLGKGGKPVKMTGEMPKRRAALTSMGVQKKPGTLVTLKGQRAKDHEIGCLDGARLAAAVEALRSTAPVSTDITDTGIRAELRPGTKGTVVLAAPRIAGWTCEGVPAEKYGGLVAVSADDRTSVTCTFRPPGLKAGLGAGGLAGALLVAWLLWLARRARGDRSSELGA